VSGDLEERAILVVYGRSRLKLIWMVWYVCYVIHPRIFYKSVRQVGLVLFFYTPFHLPMDHETKTTWDAAYEVRSLTWQKAFNMDPVLLEKASSYFRMELFLALQIESTWCHDLRAYKRKSCASMGLALLDENALPSVEWTYFPTV
jgi:hypothetical protein